MFMYFRSSGFLSLLRPGTACGPPGYKRQFIESSCQFIMNITNLLTKTGLHYYSVISFNNFLSFIFIIHFSNAYLIWVGTIFFCFYGVIVRYKNVLRSHKTHGRNTAENPYPSHCIIWIMALWLT
jgi:hypothetical protein